MCFKAHTHRVWNDKREEYRWIHLEGSVKFQQEGKQLLYCVYSDVSEQQRLEKELTDTSGKMQDIINAIPGGVAIYKVSDIFETIYFSDGVPELTGYTTCEYQELIKGDAAEMTYWEDTGTVVSKLREAIQTHTIADFEFRKLHRNGQIVWVHIQAKQIGEEDGCPLLQCVFHNISTLKETQLELNHLVNSIPGGIASYRVEQDRFIPIYFSDGVTALTGHTRKEYGELVGDNAFDTIYEPDKERVVTAVRAAMISGEVMDVSYRVRHKNGNLIWLHFNGRRMDPFSKVMRFYAVFTGTSTETQLFQSIANETADGIYVIGKDTYELLYINESKALFANGKRCAGQTCYSALHGRHKPCEFCTLKQYAADGKEHEILVDNTNRYFTARFIKTDWNGIPAYVQYIRDVTEETNTRREKERLEMYFQSIVKNLPGAITVIRCEPDGSMVPEYISDGFAAMTHMTVEEAGALYGKDVFAGVHPDDMENNRDKLCQCIERGETHCELTVRMKRGDGGYVWVKNALSLQRTADSVLRLYSIYTDISKAVEEKEQFRRQYEEIILQHYRRPSPDKLILGHCNVTQNRIIEINDYTDSNLLKTFGSNRTEFFTGLSSLIVGEKEQQRFLGTYLNEPALAAFERNETEQIVKCLIKLPNETNGRYVQFKVNLVETPDTGDITGILTVKDITEKMIFDRILHQLSVTSYDYVIDLDLTKDAYTVLVCNKDAHLAPKAHGIYSARVTDMTQNAIVPKDKERYAIFLANDEICRRLEMEDSYTFSYSLTDEGGEIRTKNMTVSAVDMRLGRACLVCSDITDSVREQQGLLNMIAYTFDLAGFIQTGSKRFTLYTRQDVLENLPPMVIENYNKVINGVADRYGTEEDREEVHKQLSLETMLQRLSDRPGGYDFVFPYNSGKGIRYKQINVLWGDENHRTVCLVRADVTDMLAAERQSKNTLEKALELAEEANRAKSDFLSAMSHDIRTPMNAIMGMTTLAAVHLDDRDRVEDCLRKISVSSKHLLSLINDVLDMSKLDGSKITLNRMEITLCDLMEQLNSIMAPQAADAGVHFNIVMGEIRHQSFYGDALRINQILINLLSNAIKFTQEKGKVEFSVEEVNSAASKGKAFYRFTVRDTGIGMPQEFLSQIFEPFTRSRTAARIEGTGLGLSITKGLVDLMEGKISVESQAGKGSVFQVELEFELIKEKSVPHTEKQLDNILPADKQLVGCRFLVAEDNSINAEILWELLDLRGAKSDLRTDGLQTVNAFRESEPGTFDAILMDIQMPEMDGYEATRAIRKLERPDAETIPILAMTANAFSEDVQASLDAGMTAHVAKPIDIDVLVMTLSKVLHE